MLSILPSVPFSTSLFNSCSPAYSCQRSEVLLGIKRVSSTDPVLPTDGSAKGTVANTNSRITNAVMNMVFAKNWTGQDFSIFSQTLMNFTEILAYTRSPTGLGL